MYVELHPDNPEQHKLARIINELKSGGVAIIPTDSVYALACDLKSKKAVEKICLLKGIKTNNAKFSIICDDLSHLSDYTSPLSKNIFRVLKRNLPGPFTFILPANNNVPKIFDNKKKTIGLRVTDNEITRSITTALGNPIVVTSLPIDDEDDFNDYLIDPYEIRERYENQVDVIVDGGWGNNVPTAIIDCLSDDIEVIRKGNMDLIL